MIYPLIACTLVLAFLSPTPVQNAAPTPAPVVMQEDAAPLLGVGFISVDGWVCFATIDGGDLFPVGPFKDPGPLDAPAPGIAEVSYVDAKGNTIKVVMPCSNYSTEDACWVAAKKALAAAEKHFPKPVPAKD